LEEILKKYLILLFFLICYNIRIFSQTPLALDMNISDEIWLEGEIVIFNGWPPNIRMIVMENHVIGIDENDFLKNFEKYLSFGLPKGNFKLKLIYKASIPYYETYYETELLVFRMYPSILTVNFNHPPKTSNWPVV
jgi:hypothetical protein